MNINNDLLKRYALANERGDICQDDEKDPIGVFYAQAELLMNATKDELNKDSILSLPVGGHADIMYGPADTLGLFLGYETIHSARRFTVQEATATKPAVVEDRGLVGRLTYIHMF